MAISQSRYVLITSAVGGSAKVSRRELIARLMTTNTKAPTKGVLEFGGGASAALKNVGAYFGTESAEYAFASKYFAWVSKQATQANKISFARYTPNATAPMLMSTASLADATAIQAVKNGSFILSMGGISATISDLDFSAASSYSAIAGVIETAIKDYSAGGELFTNATFTYDNGFVLTGGVAGEASIVALSSAGTGTDISGMLGLNAASNPIVSAGCDAETPAEAIARIANISNNFGSFDFIGSLSTADIKALAEWNAAQNVMYVFSHAVNASNYAEVQEDVKGIEGCCLTLDKNNDNGSYMPMVIGASIDYDRAGAATNFMFQQFPNDGVSVSDDADADKYDALKINYNGATQQAGKIISFYQRGYLQGENIVDLGVYYNEMWLKDAFVTEFMNLLLAVNQLPANENGSSTARGVMIPVIEQAKLNGVISVGKDLTSTQKAYIGQLTGDADAWREVEQNGCYLTVTVESYIDESKVQAYRFKYLLVYAKGDSIRMVTGDNVLI